MNIDIDNFKHINDTFGHEQGDTVIQILANRLKKLAAEKSFFLARESNDDFTLLLDFFRKK